MAPEAGESLHDATWAEVLRPEGSNHQPFQRSAHWELRATVRPGRSPWRQDGLCGQLREFVASSASPRQQRQRQQEEGPGAARGEDMDEESLQELYSWVDAMQLSRAKRNLARDFSDGVLIAEVVKFHFPKMVEMHNYTPASSTQQKMSNWAHLNRKVFTRLNFYVPDDVVRKVVQCSPGVVEFVLSTLRLKIGEKLKQKHNKTIPSPQDLEYYSMAVEQDLASPRTRGNATGNHHDIQLQADYSKSHTKAQSSYAQLSPEVRILMEEKELALLAFRETVQILQVKIRRLEQLLCLKDVRIDDLTRRLQQAEQR
ncbi:sperm flagellar protein 1-like [Leucoraja erinacea]|uniref:sperm flagellar protein 1-like n=1 Tax=Leucoraja erinaceus TaxID=7782 RepID=UPI002455316A|nr:sperm flagellar protein 1-like [Leucoraja erinacea]